MKKIDGFGRLGSYGFIGPSKMVRPLPSRCKQDSPLPKRSLYVLLWHVTPHGNGRTRAILTVKDSLGGLGLLHR